MGGHFVQQREAAAVAREKELQPPGGIDRVGNIQQLLRLQDAVTRGAIHRDADIANAPQGDAPLLLNRETRLGRLRLALLDLTKIGQWHHSADAFLAELARRVRQQQFSYSLVLQNPQ